MKTHLCKQLARASAAAAVLIAALPTTALAEGEEASGGIDLLIPALAEFVPAAIAFTVIFVVLSRLVWPSVVKMMADREQAIAASFEEADAVKARAAELEREIDDKLSRARDEAADIVARAKREAEDERARILAEAKIEAADTIEKGHKAVDSERKRAMSELSKSVIDLSVEIASRIIGNDLDDEGHRALAERYLSEVGSEDADQ